MIGHDVAFDRTDADSSFSLAQWSNAWAQAAVGAGLAIGSFLLWRRINGGLQQPLTWSSLLLVALTLILAAWLMRWMWGGASLGRQLLPSLMILAVGLAVSLPLTNRSALAAFWGLLLGSELVAWLRGLAGEEKRASDTSPPAELDAPIAIVTDVPVGELNQLDHREGSPEVGVEAEQAAEADGDVIQQLTRTRSPEGQEVFSGELRAEFSAGERQSRLHIAFCPPLEKPPQVFAEATDVDERLGEVAVKVAQVLSLGARIDVELKSPAPADGAVRVEFYATSDD